ncbi:MAG TPA: NAD(P)-binding oxidoreductase [Wenzhouxiangellaceae bacterium]|nr:NAD(P)-binding oxidoreductase [Wenzhouxiangellaceae bacterium]
MSGPHGTGITILLLGATGATGRLLLGQLIAQGHEVCAIVRSRASVPPQLRAHPRLALTQGTVLDLDDDALLRHVQDCDAVVSCLGHTLSFKGMFGAPRKLVTASVRRVCHAITESRPRPRVRVVLMGSSGVRNLDVRERISPAQSGVIFLLRWLLPPHRDNEQAAEHLRTHIGQNHPFVEWTVVRPDGLVDEDEVSEYDLHASPTRSAIFDAGSVSRANVAHFIKRLVTDDETWDEWHGRMPVIYGCENARPTDT